jgi:hypothetical protein
MKNIIYLVIIAAIGSCTTARLPVPDTFSSQATKMPVKGIQGWQVNQKLQFGSYTTSKIRRGWDFTASVQYTKFRMSPEEAILRVFDITTDKNINTQKNRFQYAIENGSLVAEIFATEKFRESQLVYKSNNPWIGSASKTNKYEYAFTAAIIPLGTKGNDPWSLVLINRYDIANDTVKRIFDRPYVEEEGYATNGKESIAIRPLRLDHVAGNSGQQTKVLGRRLLSGYELHLNGEVAGIIDILDNNIWLLNNASPEAKLIMASISSAILLKRMQDVEKDKEHVSR